MEAVSLLALNLLQRSEKLLQVYSYRGTHLHDKILRGGIHIFLNKTDILNSHNSHIIYIFI